MKAWNRCRFVTTDSRCERTARAVCKMWSALVEATAASTKRCTIRQSCSRIEISGTKSTTKTSKSKLVVRKYEKTSFVLLIVYARTRVGGSRHGPLQRRLEQRTRLSQQFSVFPHHALLLGYFTWCSCATLLSAMPYALPYAMLCLS